MIRKNDCRDTKKLLVFQMYAPCRIFICNRGSNESANGKRPVKRAYNMIPKAQISCAGFGRGADVF